MNTVGALGDNPITKTTLFAPPSIFISNRYTRHNDNAAKNHMDI